MKNLVFESQLVEAQKSLEAFAYSLTLDREEAKDLTQDTCLKALTSQRSFEEGSNLKAWLFTIMKNTFINNYRKNKKRQNIFSKEGEIPWMNNLASDNAYSADHNTNHSQLILLINKLPMEQKIPFEMLNQGYKYYEIADEQHIPIGTVKSRIFLARQKLSEQLKY
jgi:RNA polymerase sigma-70 factor (ECF subfamily)